eukprot:767107-Hanusia_phi.AAC.3
MVVIAQSLRLPQTTTQHGPSMICHLKLPEGYGLSYDNVDAFDLIVLSHNSGSCGEHDTEESDTSGRARVVLEPRSSAVWRRI